MIGEGDCRETYASFCTGLDIRPAHIFWEKKRKEKKSNYQINSKVFNALEFNPYAQPYNPLMRVNKFRGKTL
jgi:hypothetical protein